MKVEFEDLEHIKIYIYKENNINIDEEYLKTLFQKLDKFYNITLSGFFKADIYIDKNYGYIIYLEKEDIEYYDYYDNKVDMILTFEETEFLYQIDDELYFNKPKYIDILFLEKKMYAKINTNISIKEMSKLLEMTNEIRV